MHHGGGWFIFCGVAGVVQVRTRSICWSVGKVTITQLVSAPYMFVRSCVDSSPRGRLYAQEVCAQDIPTSYVTVSSGDQFNQLGETNQRRLGLV